MLIHCFPYAKLNLCASEPPDGVGIGFALNSGAIDRTTPPMAEQWYLVARPKPEATDANGDSLSGAGEDDPVQQDRITLARRAIGLDNDSHKTAPAAYPYHYGGIEW